MNSTFACAHRVKMDLFRRYGLIAAAGDRHLAEFMPGEMYLKDPQTVADWKFGLTTVRDGRQNLLGSKHLMAAAKGFDTRKNLIQRFYTQGHGIGIVDDPGLRTVFPNGLSKLHEHRQCAQSAYHASRPRRIPYRLIDAKPLRQVYIRLHLVKSFGQNGNHHKGR